MMGLIFGAIRLGSMAARASQRSQQAKAAAPPAPKPPPPPDPQVLRDAAALRFELRMRAQGRAG